MKILIYMADMVRGDLIDLMDGDHPLEKDLKKLGGTFYSNTYTPAPDTPRSTASLFSGKYPKHHGVTLRSTQITTSYDATNKSILRLLCDSGFEVGVLMGEDLFFLDIGLPNDLGEKFRVFYKSHDLYEWVREKESINSNIVIYRHDNSYHDVIDFASRLNNPHKIGLDSVHKHFKEITEQIDFEYIWLASDHGCILPGESKDSRDFLDKNRTQVLMYRYFYKDKLNGIKISYRLSTIMDVYPTIMEDLNLDFDQSQIDGISFNSPEGHGNIFQEDYSDLAFIDSYRLPDLYQAISGDTKFLLDREGFWKKDVTAKNWEKIDHWPPLLDLAALKHLAWYKLAKQIVDARLRIEKGFAEFRENRVRQSHSPRLVVTMKSKLRSHAPKKIVLAYGKLRKYRALSSPKKWK